MCIRISSQIIPCAYGWLLIKTAWLFQDTVFKYFNFQYNKWTDFHNIGKEMCVVVVVVFLLVIRQRPLQWFSLRVSLLFRILQMKHLLTPLNTINPSYWTLKQKCLNQSKSTSLSFMLLEILLVCMILTQWSSKVVVWAGSKEDDYWVNFHLFSF